MWWVVGAEADRDGWCLAECRTLSRVWNSRLGHVCPAWLGEASGDLQWVLSPWTGSGSVVNVAERTA